MPLFVCKQLFTEVHGGFNTYVEIDHTAKRIALTRQRMENTMVIKRDRASRTGRWIRFPACHDNIIQMQ